MKKITQTYGEDQKVFLRTAVPWPILVTEIVVAVLYFGIITFRYHPSNPWLFGVLIAGEIFHLWGVLTYIYTIWNTETQTKNFDPAFAQPVDVFITVAGEPVRVIEETAKAALDMRYTGEFHITLLNDGYVAKKDNWQEVEKLAKRLGIDCITRKTPGGFKAGNINNGIRQTQAPFCVVFDADHVPHPDFLEKTMGYFTDRKTAFVQSPQFYKNHAQNYITGAAWEQQELFFGPICKGKNRLNSATMCGTNMVIRKSALAEVGGVNETNIAEDFLTGLLLHAKGWKSVYVPEVLAEGLAPEDFLSYYKQQHRWARGGLEVVFKYNPLFMRGLTWSQRIQYLASASYFLSGIVVVANALLPLVFFYTGQVPLQISTMALAAVFLPYIFWTIYMLQQSSNHSFTFRALAFSMSSFGIHFQALAAVLLGTKTAFAITSKTKVAGNFIRFVIPHLIYLLLVIGGVGVAIIREGVSASVITNIAWAIFNVVVFLPFISAALPERGGTTEPVITPGAAPVINSKLIS